MQGYSKALNALQSPISSECNNSRLVRVNTSHIPAYVWGYPHSLARILAHTGRMSGTNRNLTAQRPMARIKLGKRSYAVPGSKPVRIALGVALVFLGMLGFLPIIGFWMIPLGLLVLSVDSWRVRRMRRRLEVWYGRRKEAKASQKAKAASDTETA